MRETAGRSFGLCPFCAFSRPVETARGSRFLLCTRSKLEPEFVRYPPQPVLRCRGFSEREDWSGSGPGERGAGG